MKHRFYFVVIAFASLMLLGGNVSQAGDIQRNASVKQQ
ncbi:hypothetical protein KKH3_39060 [Pectobacterium actinidiae]|nr:hypothetical protein KKH3_39060 [Pectobacterium actinidiae]